MARIETVAQLRQRYRDATPRSLAKQLDHLDRHCRRFISLAPFAVIASSSRAGPGDVSPRGGHPGFAQTPDARTVLLPDASGNNRLDTLTNLMENPEIGLLFMIPGVDETLRINGTAELRDDPELIAGFDGERRPPAAVIRIAVRDAYLHCAKALMRSRLWDERSKVERGRLPTMNEMIRDHTGTTGPVEPQDEMIERYRKEL